MAGFALVEQLTLGVRELVEFYVRPECRRQGVARSAAGALFAQRGESWVVGVRKDNAHGLAFWRSILERRGFAQRAEIEGPPAYVYRFVWPGEA